MPTFYVYMLAGRKDGPLYIGLTNDLIRRVYEHKKGIFEGFTKKYHVHKLVYFEKTADVLKAILLEKRLKKWRRQWKIELIEKHNLQWRDLYYDLF